MHGHQLAVCAQGLAEAFASALAEVVVACDVEGTGGLCALGNANINTTISAVAETFAFGYAKATRECGENKCEVDAVALGEAVSEAVSSAAASAIAGGCTGLSPPVAILPHAW